MGDMELQIFADRLKELRTKNGMTQAQFVDGLGITASALSAYEKNQKNPSISVAKRISEKYNVSIDWLCGLSENQERDTINIKTYSDIIKLWIKTGRSLSALENIATNFRNTMFKFIEEAKRMEMLNKDNMIDDDLYNLWLVKNIQKYNSPIMMHYCEKIENPYIMQEDKFEQVVDIISNTLHDNNIRIVKKETSNNSSTAAHNPEVPEETPEDSDGSKGTDN